MFLFLIIFHISIDISSEEGPNKLSFNPRKIRIKHKEYINRYYPSVLYTQSGIEVMDYGKDFTLYHESFINNLVTYIFYVSFVNSIIRCKESRS